MRQIPLRNLILALVVGVLALIDLSARADTALMQARRSAASDGTSLAGRLLVATPDMGDPRFARTVIFMARHDDGGALGLVINRVVGTLDPDVIAKRYGGKATEPSASVTVHYGGPVSPRTGFIIHSDERVADGTIAQFDGIAINNSVDMLLAIAQGSGPDRFMVMFGYAGWAAGQLESELAAGAWVVASADFDFVFDPDHQGKWQRAYDRRMIEL